MGKKTIYATFFVLFVFPFSCPTCSKTCPQSERSRQGCCKGARHIQNQQPWRPRANPWRGWL